MANLTNSENMRVALENIESFLTKFASQSPTLLDEIRSAGTILKQTNLRNVHSLGKNSSSILQMLMVEGKRTRRKVDSLSVLNTTSLELEQHLLLQKYCIYLEEAFSLLYALNLALHEVQLTANALYVHGLKEDTPQLQEMEKLKDAIARLVSIVSSKHFKSTLTTGVA
uniref:Uncharacterized protein n=1 Tax=Anopheles culicifacies TaxID=139723 RepID=A0A182M7F7_9DIPT